MRFPPPSGARSADEHSFAADSTILPAKGWVITGLPLIGGEITAIFVEHGGTRKR
jgi:hypothetical protein